MAKQEFSDAARSPTSKMMPMKFQEAEAPRQPLQVGQKTLKQSYRVIQFDSSCENDHGAKYVIKPLPPKPLDPNRREQPDFHQQCTFE